MGAAEEKVRSLFATLLQVPPEEVRDDSRPGTLARWDSMQHLMLVSGFEEELGIDLEPEEMVEMYADFATFKRIVLQKL
jgi:acyl carrier protein